MDERARFKQDENQYDATLDNIQEQNYSQMRNNLNEFGGFNNNPEMMRLVGSSGDNFNNFNNFN